MLQFLTFKHVKCTLNYEKLKLKTLLFNNDCNLSILVLEKVPVGYRLFFHEALRDNQQRLEYIIWY